MNCFCKGVIFGMIAGATVGAVAVAKNKNLSNMVKEKSEIVEHKLSNMIDSVKQKICNCNKNTNNSSSKDQANGNCNCQDETNTECNCQGETFTSCNCQTR